MPLSSGTSILEGRGTSESNETASVSSGDSQANSSQMAKRGKNFFMDTLGFP
jgi:hypothetical protein